MMRWSVGKTGIILILLAAGCFISCDPWFAYSPYEGNVDAAHHGSTESQLALINALDTDDSGPFKIAVLSDPHYHYSKLYDAVAHINAQDDFAFAVVVGDLSENGLKQEFIYFRDAMSKLRIPYLTVIGNHDYLSNGELVYSQMFGPYNYSFVFNKVKFVFFDNNTIESEKEPDMTWLEAELSSNQGYNHVIPFSHIPPYDQQMKNHYEEFHRMLVDNNIDLSVHGHRHDWSMDQVYGDGVDYVTVSSPQKRAYTELSITDVGIDVKRIEY
jgi:predicted phosphodiesterase